MGSRALSTAVELAAARFSIVTTAELLAAGLPPQAAERQVRAGRWQRPARGVYVTHARPLTGPDLGRVATVHAGAPVIVSGLVAVRELGMRWVPAAPEVVALVDASVRTPSSGRVRLIRTKGVDDLGTWRRAGLDWADPDRAVVDAARQLGRLGDVRGVVLGAVHDGWASPDDLGRALSATQRNGSGLTRRAVLDALRGCVSPPEAELVDALVGRRLPFYANPQLVLGGRLLGEPDVWFVGRGIGGEVESKAHHGSAADVETTYDRHERISAHGIELVHLSVSRIRRDAREAATHLLGRVLARSGRADTEPPGLVVVPRGPLLR